MGRGLFRDGSYYKSVFLGKRTVKSGECAVLWSLGGKSKEVEGPRRVWMWCTTVTFLDRFSANQFEYLRVQHKNGVVEHLRGPLTMYKNPVLHEKVQKIKAVVLPAGTAVVVYRQEAHGVPADSLPGKQILAGTANSAGDVSHRLVRGPAVFMPSATEWMHDFSWANTAREDDDQASPYRLSLLLEQCKCNVQNLATSDGGAVGVRAILQYQVVNIDKVLGSSSNPLENMHDAMRTDLIAFASKCTVEQFAASSNLRLGSLETYPSLVKCAESCGIVVHQVVFQGSDVLTASASATQSKAKQSKLTQNEETARLELELSNLKLEHSMQQEIKKCSHQAELEAAKSEAARLKQEAELLLEESKHSQEVRHQREDNEVYLHRMRGLADLGVDLTQVLVAQMVAPPATKEGQPPLPVSPDVKEAEPTNRSTAAKASSPVPPPPPPPSSVKRTPAPSVNRSR